MTIKGFNAISLPLSGSQLIEASAGTGKTYTITNLFLRLLLGRDDHFDSPLTVDRILVLTFTIAATDELKHRITRRIIDAREAFRVGSSEDDFIEALIQSSTDPEKDRKLLTAASQLMDEAAIFTIHGFCARVLGEQAFESGQLFDQELNAERDELLKVAAEDCFRRDILEAPALIRQTAISIWPTPQHLASMMAPLLFREQLHSYPAEVSVDHDQLVDWIAQAKQLWLDDNLADQLKTCGLRANSRHLKQLDAMTAFCESDEQNLTHDFWSMYQYEKLEAARLKSGQIPQHAFFSLAEQITASATHISTNLWQQLTRRLREHVSSQKLTRGQMTLDDLLSQLASAVKQPGSSLPGTMAARWPVALIDEFQDTDAVQSAIFNTVYQGEHENLLMIGDPKQAIYQFRGADVFTYINARRQASDIHTLKVNQRSSPQVVAATNWLFELPQVFDNDTDIPFEPVQHAERHAKMRLTEAGEPTPPYCLFHVGDADANINITEARERAMAWAAEETVRLLNPAAEIKADEEQLHAGQIAFLVRNRKDAAAARAALAARGIKSVYLTLESVFLQETASDLLLILKAVLEPTSDRAIRTALGSRLMQTPAVEIDAISRDVREQQRVLSEFEEYHRLWAENDVAPMLNSMIEQRQIASRWLSQTTGEREITNLRHLIEILQQRSLRSPGMFQLVKWFEQEQRLAQTVSSEERQLRLESDENLIKIVTMHAAKGLEYDVVMIPMPVFRSRNPAKEPAIFHEEQQGWYRCAVELGDNPVHRETAAAESLAEDMRLLYVAMTRAKYRCYLGLPKCADLGNTAFSRLLRIEGYSKTFNLFEHTNVHFPAELFQLVNGNHPQLTQLDEGETANAWVAPPARPLISDNWRLHSYTGLASRLAERSAHAARVVTGFGDDDAEESDQQNSSRRNRFTFPRGARAGVVLHSLMEDIDFQDSPSQQVACERTLQRLGLEPEWQPVVEHWLNDILDADLHGFSLRHLARANRRDEMEFHFPIQAALDLADFLIDHQLSHQADHSRLALEGMMTGLIDLLYRHEGRYYIVDYKSNHLGNQVSDYEPELLGHAMSEHQYHLQYMLYSVAVQRFLRARLPDYRYDTHFGGVYYLFLRGLAAGSNTGVFHIRPERTLIDELDQKLDARHG